MFTLTDFFFIMVYRKIHISSFFFNKETKERYFYERMFFLADGNRTFYELSDYVFCYDYGRVIISL